jgi:hypothetical protein
VNPERLFVRVSLSGIVVLVSLFFAPFMVLLKVAEGVFVAAKITQESIQQVWSARGDSRLD